MGDRDRLRRVEETSKRKSRLSRPAARVGTRIVTGLAKGIGSFFSRGGLRHPDDMITRGRNRSLYILGGSQMNPLPSRQKPLQGKESLTGAPRNNPRPGRKQRKLKGLTWAQKLERGKRSILG